MQTFLPYPDFAETAAALDYRRLGKQRAENIQILRGMTIPGYGWSNHPAVRMWADYKTAFLMYHLAIVGEWHDVRGYKDNGTIATFNTDLRDFYKANPDQTEDDHHLVLPSWLGDEDFHRSHQSNLIRKDPIHYGPQFPGVPDNLEYVWPV